MPAKIATSEDLQSELRTLWAMTEEENPSREKLAAALNDLAQRVAGSIPQPIKYYLDPHYLQIYSIFESYGRVHHVTGDLTLIEKKLLVIRNAIMNLFQNTKDKTVVYPEFNDVIVDGVPGGRNKMIVYTNISMPSFSENFTEGHKILFDKILGHYPEEKP
jgi:hypothetical protein